MLFWVFFILFGDCMGILKLCFRPCFRPCFRLVQRKSTTFKQIVALQSTAFYLAVVEDWAVDTSIVPSRVCWRPIEAHILQNSWATAPHVDTKTENWIVSKVNLVWHSNQLFVVQLRDTSCVTRIFLFNVKPPEVGSGCSKCKQLVRVPDSLLENKILARIGSFLLLERENFFFYFFFKN